MYKIQLQPEVTRCFHLVTKSRHFTNKMAEHKILISEIFVKLHFQGFIQRAVKSFLAEIDKFQRFSAKLGKL